MLRQRPTQYILLIVSLGLYLFITYQLQRHESALLISSFTALFAFYCWIYVNAEEHEVTFWTYASVLLRLSFLLVLPTLSDDFYRFIWDGRLLVNGYHPFADTPSHYIQEGINSRGIDQELYSKLNSPNYVTIYPPVPQFIFWIAAIVSPNSISGSVMVMRLSVLIAEIGNIVLINRLLKEFNLPQKTILLYALNPLVILELTGNLHHEAFMILFVLAAVYLLNVNLVMSGISFGIAICVKLLPVLFIPVLIRRLGWKKGVVFSATASLVCLLLFYPLMSLDIVKGYTTSVGYYLSYFEFNASLYYLVREFGFLIYNYNIIQTVGWKLVTIAALLILFYSTSNFFRKKIGIEGLHENSSEQSLLLDFVVILLIYFLFTTTLHPWYVTSLLAFSIFTTFRFPLIWTYVIFLTYIGYAVDSFQENLWIVLFEYLAVFSFLAFELYNLKMDQKVNQSRSKKQNRL